MLYLGLGDGGAANDPQGHGQNRQTLLGAIIRIDVNDIDASTPYRIPTDNPFLGIAGVRPEIWAYGLRNPWRMAFDPATDQLWVGDVGQDRVEEIAIVQAGENHGWNVFEGDECFPQRRRVRRAARGRCAGRDVRSRRGLLGHRRPGLSR